jgi:hypothetical protein
VRDRDIDTLAQYIDGPNLGRQRQQFAPGGRNARRQRRDSE